MSDDPSIPLLRGVFYFLRHGETESNLRATIAGSMDVSLTAQGREQADSAALALENQGITAVYSSALRRARDTAEIVSRRLKLRVPGVTPDGAETPEEFSQRIIAGLAKVAGAGIPLIVAHSGVYRVLCQK